MAAYDSNEMRRYRPSDFYDDSILREIEASGFIDALYQQKQSGLPVSLVTSVPQSN
jgi:hypothetical protein